MTASQYLEYLKNRINLGENPFTERGARLLVLQAEDGSLWVGQAEFEQSVRDLAVLEGWRFTGQDGQPAAIEAYTSYPHRVDFDTSAGRFSLGFADPATLLVVLPPGRCGLTLRTPARGTADAQGGVLRAAVPAFTLAYTTGAPVVQNSIRDTASGALLELLVENESASAVALNITRSGLPDRHVPEPAGVFESAARRWHDWFAAAPPVPEPYRAQYYFAWWVLGINLLRLRFHPQHEGMVPSKLGYVGVWNWDAYFHAIGYRHAHMDLARDQFRILFEHQLDNGMVADVIYDGGVLAHTTRLVEADITKPPLTAWAVWKLYESDGDPAFLAEMYGPMVRAQAWWFAAQDVNGDGLCEYGHPYSSGLDDSPLWDQGLPVESPDLNAYLCLQYDTLAKMAGVLGKPDDAHDWTSRAEALAQRLLSRWDEGAGFFRALYNGQPLDVKTPFNLFPLITGRLPRAIADRLVAALTDPAQFWPAYPVPTVALDDPVHDPATMWRGPVWINVNYLLVDGLLRAGYADAAGALRRRTLDLVMQGDSIYEYYDPQTGAKAPRAASTFGWSSALFIDLLLQELQE